MSCCSKMIRTSILDGNIFAICSNLIFRYECMFFKIVQMADLVVLAMYTTTKTEGCFPSITFSRFCLEVVESLPCDFAYSQLCLQRLQLQCTAQQKL